MNCLLSGISTKRPLTVIPQKNILISKRTFFGNFEYDRHILSFQKNTHLSIGTHFIVVLIDISIDWVLKYTLSFGYRSIIDTCSRGGEDARSVVICAPYGPVGI